jgi:hypothetical protein
MPLLQVFIPNFAKFAELVSIQLNMTLILDIIVRYKVEIKVTPFQEMLLLRTSLGT